MTPQGGPPRGSRPTRVHLDTDFAGDTDDACALAMLLGWPGVELVGVTTSADPDGRRAGYAAHLLSLAGRDDVPVAAGAPASITTGAPMGDLPPHDRYWREPVAPEPADPTGALALLERSIDLDATIVAIGPYTTLALLERHAPGLLRRARVVVMGGWIEAPARGLPAWGPEMDWNVQCDTDAATVILDAAGDLSMTTLTATLDAHLRSMHLPRLRASGALGELLAHQAEAHAADHGMAELGRSHDRLPDDLLNFQYDPVACAVAVGWSGATLEERHVRAVVEDGVLRFADSPHGRRAHVVTRVDTEAFSEAWLDAVETADRIAARR